MKSVGLSQASTPLANFTTVTPMFGMVRREATAAAAGTVSTSARVTEVSAHGVTATVSAAASAPRKSLSLGRTRPVFCGAVASTMSLPLVRRARDEAAMSSSEIPGSTLCTS